MIRSIADFARACEEGRYHCQRFIKTGAGQASDTRWQDWAFQAGQPAYDARIGQALAFMPSVAQGNDAIYFPPIADGMQRKLFKITMRPQASNSLQASIDFVLYDLVGYYPLIDGDSTDPQEFDNTLTLPRYTDGNGLRLVLVNHVAPAVQGGVMNLEYVDQTGATRTITLGVPNNGINGPCCAANSSTVNNSSPLVLPLHEGVTGVRQVNRIVYTTPPGGLHCIYVIKPLAQFTHYHDALLQADTTGVKAALEIDFATKDGWRMPDIPNGAHLAFFYRTVGGGRTAVFFGDFEFIWG